jgi:hypothetical protein
MDDHPQKPAASTPAESSSVPKETWEQRLARIRIFDRQSIRGQYCGFIDILGFGAATQRDLSAVLSLYEELLEETLSCILAVPVPTRSTARRNR